MIKHYPIIVIGAGAGGLVVANGAAKAGKRPLLIERGSWGGDCTNFGCIPSKSLIAAAEVAHASSFAKVLGLSFSQNRFNGDGALARMQEVVQKIRSTEEPEALQAKGVETLTGMAHFVEPHLLHITSKEGPATEVYGDQIVIATGSSPTHPPIPGLDQVPFHTNETIFSLKNIPKSLGVIGGGPIGCELAQAFSRLGSTVTLIQLHKHILLREEPWVQKLITKQFEREGIALYLNCETTKVRRDGEEIVLSAADRNTKKTGEIRVDTLLIATGRKPNIEALQIDKIGLKRTATGIWVDRYGRTSHQHIWAIGDVVGRAPFTHVAENEGRTVLANLLSPWPIRWRLDHAQAVPHVTFTDPEVAAVGMREAEAIARYGNRRIAIYKLSFDELDRAITAGRTEDEIRVVTKRWSSRILGATIAAPRAGEMLQELSLAMHAGIPLRKLAALIHPYPTYSLAIRKLADQWLTKTILPLFLRRLHK